MLLKHNRHILNSPGIYVQIEEMSDEDRTIWLEIHRRTSLALLGTWEVVKTVLCIDAPEGHVPEDLEDVHDLTTKDVLSYSWRALAEAR
jgi:hypothetical protein